VAGFALIPMSEQLPNPDVEWLDHVQPVGLVVAPSLLEELGLTPLRQSPIDSALAAEHLEPDADKPALPDPWAFFAGVLGWEPQYVAGSPQGPAVASELFLSLPEHGTVLSPTWTVAELGSAACKWQLLVRIEPAGVDPDARNALDGWEASPQQRFERLLRDTSVFAGVLLTDHTLRLIYAPRGESSGYLSFPLRALGTVAGRAMLGGLKLLLNRSRLFSDAEERRLPAILRKSRDAQASVSSALADQVLGALHELLRGLDRAEHALLRGLAASQPEPLYEGLLAVLMRLVFVLYAEDRDLLPSLASGRAREIYENSYSVRGLYARLVQDAALNPDTMDERYGGYGRLLALFRLIHSGHRSHFIQARGGKLFDPDEFLFLEGRTSRIDPPRILRVSDGCLLRILEGLMTLRVRGGERERLSYRTLDVEQIGSVYETVMGFTVQVARGPVLAIKAGKHNRTPVFVELDALAAASGKERIKYLKEHAGRGQLSANVTRAVEAARSADELAAVLEAIADERASPVRQASRSGTPILQPTGERRRSGSHYTPRSLTAPIVRFALDPSLERLGGDATTGQILDLKVCDPAMGSGAFLVEACRVLGVRLVAAWARWPDQRPVIPADEDEELHARRLVAQRCLYGVDRNPRAVDLARLSLWLATLARDHEFTFLDHALKCGDSLVGVTDGQIQSLHWDLGAGLPLFSGLVREKVALAIQGRSEIREAADNEPRAKQEARFQQVEAQLQGARLIGTALVAAFFSSEKQKLREAARQKIESWANGSPDELWPLLEAQAAGLRTGDHPLTPFHWQIEFPEVFVRNNPGFDAIVGNPPFAGKNSIIAGNPRNYLPWLQTLHDGAHGNADLVAHFFRRAFGLLRQHGSFGLIATNTIGQGDTRASGLTRIITDGGAIARATRRLKWPGEAAVVVSIVHVVKGNAVAPMLDGNHVRRISAYLVEGDLDVSPQSLVANSGKAFQGSILLGMGFTFDDLAAAKGKAETLDTMNELIRKDPRNATRIFPYIGGEEVNTDPRHQHHRYVIDFFNRPLRRDKRLRPWAEMSAEEKTGCTVTGIMPDDYPEEVAEDWPDLIEIVRRRVKPERDPQKRDALRIRWWQYAEKRPGLYTAIAALPKVIAVNCGASPHAAFATLDSKTVFGNTLAVIALSSHAAFSVLQSRIHEFWARFFSSSMKDDLRYAPSDCFRTFPFPANFESNGSLGATGEGYYNYRAQLLVQRNEGLTKTYNSFHARSDRAPSIEQLRRLHAEMDVAVLRAYDWDDLARRAAPEFIELDADDGKSPKTRLDWPLEFKDEVLARLLALNAERAAAERAAGLVPLTTDDEEELDDLAAD
jgi:hypothetical protein